jgi:hypothetical protein
VAEGPRCHTYGLRAKQNERLYYAVLNRTRDLEYLRQPSKRQGNNNDDGALCLKWLYAYCGLAWCEQYASTHDQLKQFIATSAFYRARGQGEAARVPFERFAVFVFAKNVRTVTFKNYDSQKKENK